MKILIIGNIGSGKSTLGKKIQEITGFEFIQIDELREKFLNNSVSGEYYSLFQFLKNAESNQNVILEFTGVGCHKFAIRRALELNDDPKFVILCKTRIFSTIQERIKSKKFRYKNPFDIKIENHIEYIENELKEDIIKNFWRKENFQFIEAYMDKLNDLKINLEKLKSYFKP